ncbi:hypothetical protein HK405_012603, partial [Cladochytrium tenue]
MLSGSSNSSTIADAAASDEAPAWHKIVGISLAAGSALFIGASYVLKKRGLLDSNVKANEKPGQGYGYLKNPLWWIGLSMMLFGEICNMGAYAFSPAIIVTPLGAGSVVVSAIMSHIFLKEKLDFSSQIGSGVSALLGFLVIVGGVALLFSYSLQMTNDVTVKALHMQELRNSLRRSYLPPVNPDPPMSNLGDSTISRIHLGPQAVLEVPAEIIPLTGGHVGFYNSRASDLQHEKDGVHTTLGRVSTASEHETDASFYPSLASTRSRPDDTVPRAEAADTEAAVHFEARKTGVSKRSFPRGSVVRKESSESVTGLLEDRGGGGDGVDAVSPDASLRFDNAPNPQPPPAPGHHHQLRPHGYGTVTDTGELLPGGGGGGGGGGGMRR